LREKGTNFCGSLKPSGGSLIAPFVQLAQQLSSLGQSRSKIGGNSLPQSLAVGAAQHEGTKSAPFVLAYLRDQTAAENAPGGTVRRGWRDNNSPASGKGRREETRGLLHCVHHKLRRSSCLDCCLREIICEFAVKIGSGIE
jgi:hypothetical protein